MKDYFYIAAIIFLLFAWTNSCKNNDKNQELINAVNDTVLTYKNKQGLYESKISVLHASRKQLLSINAGKDSTIRKLQELVKKSGSGTTSATIHSGTTSGTISGNTISVSKDTIYKDSIAYIYPEYHYADSSKWHNFKITMCKDSTNLFYKINNQYSYITRYEKQKGFFSKKIPIVTVTNLNPYTTTTEIRTWQVPCHCNNKNWLIGGFILGGGSVFAIYNTKK